MITERVSAANKFIVNNRYNNNLELNGTLTINSNLIVLGDTTRLDTIAYTTERLEVVNANNTTTAFMVQQNTADRDIFVASNQSTAVFRIANNGDVNINGIGSAGIYKRNNRDVFLDTSNYILATSNTLINKADFNDRSVSNYVLSTSNLLAQRINKYSVWEPTGTNIYYYSTGNVGIGTTNPTTDLHIYDDVISETKLTIQNNYTVASSSLPTEIIVEGTTSATIGTTERYIMFPYSGTAATKDYTFTTTEGLICDILVVGGGGGGGRRHAGAGGAGTLMYHKNITLNGTYNIKVGKGGAGNPAGSPNTGTATEGNFSQFTRTDGAQNYYAVGGGRGTSGGASYATTNGGEGYLYDANLTLSSGNIFNSVSVAVSNKNYVNTLTSPEGCRGNIGGKEITDYKGGGGGGAGGVGMNHDAEATVNDGYGGLGLAIDITGTSVVYAGGGNGSDFDGSVSQVFNPSYPTIQSRGGGGYGSDNGTPQNGLDGTGGGGGAQGNDTAGGGNGGSGIVIIRYRKALSATASASIELLRGTANDGNTDYKIGNYNGDFKIMSSVSSVDTNRLLITSGGDMTLSGSLIPSSNIAYNLGSSSNKWKDLYLSGNSIYLNNTVLSSDSGADLNIKDNSGAYKNININTLQLNGAGKQITLGIDETGRLTYTNASNVTSFAITTTSVTSANLDTSILTVDKGGTGVGTLASGQLLIGNGTGNVLQTSNLRWDNTNRRLGIGTSVPENILHITDASTSNTNLMIQNTFLSNSSNSKLPNQINVVGAISTNISAFERCIIFPYLLDNTGNGQSLYTITTTENLLCDILIVGGGGGGSAGHGGGGGAGQLVFMYQATLNSGTYAIKVGKGGNKSLAANDAVITYATKGADSSFDTVVAEGGGANGANITDKNGGSGAGGDAFIGDGGTSGAGNKNTTVDTFPGATVYSRGNNGGNNQDGGVGGGGGGAGQIGINGISSSPYGKGGNGLSGIVEIGYDFKSNFGTTVGKIEGDGLVWFAGGGGGGGDFNTSGGLGGGGGGKTGYTQPGENGKDGTGSGGGGGSGYSGNGGNGGSGIVIIKYRKVFIPSSSASIELTRGIPGDANTDYKLGNFDGDFKITTSTSNVERNSMLISANGEMTLSSNLLIQSRIGIGTTSPSSKLEVYGGDILLNTNWIAGATMNILGINTSRRLEFSFNNGTSLYDTNKIRFLTGSTLLERMVIDTSGNAGIGTTNPTSRLEVYGGDIRLNTNWVSGAILNVMAYNADKRLEFSYTDGTSLYDNNRLRFFTANTQRVVIATSGNVGIGTTTPSQRVHIVHPSNNLVRIETDTSTASQISGIEFGIPSYSSATRSKITSTTYAGDASDLQFYTSSGASATTRMMITSNGNVGIGTSPDNKLHISDVVTDKTKMIIQNNYMLPELSSEIVVPGAISTIVGAADRCISFPYTTDTSGTGQTQYTFTITENLLCDILIVGGGGGGSAGHGGGGGAGQLVLIYKATLNSGSYTIKVGKGGNKAVSVNDTPVSYATKGSESSFDIVVAEGGGANTNTSSDKNGGSGAGGDAFSTDGGTSGFGNKNTILDTFPGAIVYSRGNNGGNNGGGMVGGGGGGAGKIGQDGTNSFPYGKGGDGLSGINEISYDFKTMFGTTIGKIESDGLVWFAGGGGGGGAGGGTGVLVSGGLGGGGAGKGGFGPDGDNAINSTGSGGGGGAGTSGDGGNGGSGVVIIRYRRFTEVGYVNPISSASIDFTRGLPGDANTDYKIGNFAGDFKIMSSASNVDTNHLLLTSNGDITVSGSINAASRYLLGGRNILEDTSNYVLSTSNIINERIAILNNDLLTLNENSVNNIITETGAKVSLLCNTMLAIGKLNNNNLNTTVTSFTENTTSKFVLLCNTMLAIGKLNDANISNYILASSLATSNKIVADVKAINTTVSRTNNLEVNGNLTVNSNLIVLGDSTRLETTVYTTERLEIVNANNTSTAFMVQQNTADRDIFVASNMSTEVFRMANNGNVNMNGRLGIGTATPATPLHVIGDIVATQNITSYYSDERLKTKIAGINDPLKIIDGLNGFYYIPNELARINGITNTDKEIGLSAQDVQKVLPEIVKIAPFDLETDAEGNKISKSGERYLTMSYERLAPVFVEAIKELTIKNATLEQKHSVLEQKHSVLTDKYNILLEDITIIKKTLELP
jgi:hypothetical protein